MHRHFKRAPLNDAHLIVSIQQAYNDLSKHFCSVFSFKCPFSRIFRLFKQNHTDIKWWFFISPESLKSIHTTWNKNENKTERQFYQKWRKLMVARFFSLSKHEFKLNGIFPWAEHLLWWNYTLICCKQIYHTIFFNDIIIIMDCSTKLSIIDVIQVISAIHSKK